MITIKESTIYDWLCDYEAFNYAFRKHCNIICQAFSLELEFDTNSLKLAHQKWSEDCQLWKSQHFDGEPEALSPTKVVALLLHHLSTIPFLSGVYEHTYSNDPYYKFSGTDEEFQEARKDLIAAREAVFSFDFCLAIICWYEERRLDRLQPYIFRITRDLRHDIISYLVSRKTDSKALYLIMKASFIRTARHSAAPSATVGGKPGARK